MRLIFGIVVLTSSVIALAALQYAMPASFDNPPAVNHPGIVQFRVFTPFVHVAPVHVSSFLWTFRVLLLAAWIGYGIILVSAYQNKGPATTFTLNTIAGTAVLVAFLFPPSLSSDVYAYAGWGRMWAIHGWNPYVRTLREFGEIGDPAGLIAPVAASTTHGPVWILIVCIVAGVFRNAGLWAQIVALKLLAAAALVLAAVSARAVADFYDSRKAELTLLAVGFNPVFLIEGPGNGHNDVLMAGLMLAGIAVYLKNRPRLGYLLVGFSIGIKFVTAAIVPWLIMRQVSREPHGKRVAATALALGIVLTPLVVGYTVFQVHTNVIDGIKAVYEHQTDGARASASTVGSGVAESAVAAGARSGLLRSAGLLLLYVLLTVAVWRSHVPGFYLSCWAVFSLSIIIFAAPVSFAWYMVWPISASLIGWDRFGITMNLVFGFLAAYLLAVYTLPYAR